MMRWIKICNLREEGQCLTVVLEPEWVRRTLNAGKGVVVVPGGDGKVSSKVTLKCMCVCVYVVRLLRKFKFICFFFPGQVFKCLNNIVTFLHRSLTCTNL